MKGNSRLLTLSHLTKTVKKYVLDSSASNEEILNALLEPYVDAGRVRGRKGEAFHLNAPRTSSLINGKADVPKALKHPLRRYGIVDSTAKNMGCFIADYIGEEDASLLMSDILSSLDCGEPADQSAREELSALKADASRFLAAALVESLRNCNLTTNRRLLWQHGSGSLSVEVGDLFSKGFGRRRKSRNVVVIPVESSFDTIVTTGCESIGRPRVSVRTLHGKWLQRMYACGETPESLEARISANLSLRGIEARSDIEGRGRYPIGTIAAVENDKALFFLLAVSDFDGGNISRSCPDMVRAAVSALVDTYNAMGQGLDLYLPLVGTGLSRAGLSHRGSYGLITETLAAHARDIHGSMTIMVCPDDVIRLESNDDPC